MLILGFTFKENCPDIRNTKVIDIVHTLQEYDCDITVYDPWADQESVKLHYCLDITNSSPKEKYDAIILAVAHDEFKDLNLSLLLNGRSVVYDVKGFLPKELVDARL